MPLAAIWLTTAAEARLPSSSQPWTVLPAVSNHAPNAARESERCSRKRRILEPASVIMRGALPRSGKVAQAANFPALGNSAAAPVDQLEDFGGAAQRADVPAIAAERHARGVGQVELDDRGGQEAVGEGAAQAIEHRDGDETRGGFVEDEHGGVGTAVDAEMRRRRCRGEGLGEVELEAGDQRLGAARAVERGTEGDAHAEL